MKKAGLILCIAWIVTLTANAQENQPKGKIGITFSSFGENDIIRFDELEGAASYNGDGFFTIGANYLYPLKKWLDVETGINYSHHKITVNPNLPPDMDNTPYGADFSLVDIPVTLRASFLKYFFANGGLLLDIGASTSPVDDQSGIGAMLGVGFKINLNPDISIFANPYMKSHSLISFSFEDNHQRLMENGFRFGIMYQL